ncbi:hypothetical protein QUA56_16345 [Microcoleus sp. N3A4]|uniref:hypothetical protein n=1 Tax=Microcoleus sp. N3A4 TaxID=3055379 RepID=UPI002FD4A04D
MQATTHPIANRAEEPQFLHRRPTISRAKKLVKIPFLMIIAFGRMPGKPQQLRLFFQLQGFLKSKILSLLMVEFTLIIRHLRF